MTGRRRWKSRSPACHRTHHVLSCLQTRQGRAGRSVWTFRRAWSRCTAGRHTSRRVPVDREKGASVRAVARAACSVQRAACSVQRAARSPQPAARSPQPAARSVRQHARWTHARALWVAGHAQPAARSPQPAASGSTHAGHTRARAVGGGTRGSRDSCVLTRTVLCAATHGLPAAARISQGPSAATSEARAAAGSRSAAISFE